MRQRRSGFGRRPTVETKGAIRGRTHVGGRGGFRIKLTDSPKFLSRKSAGERLGAQRLSRWASQSSDCRPPTAPFSYSVIQSTPSPYVRPSSYCALGLHCRPPPKSRPTPTVSAVLGLHFGVGRKHPGLQPPSRSPLESGESTRDCNLRRSQKKLNFNHHSHTIAMLWCV